MHAQDETTHAHCEQACGERWVPLCQPLNDDSVEQVGFLQGLVLISQLFIWEGGHQDEAGRSHRWPGIDYEEPDVTDPVQRDQTQKGNPVIEHPREQHNKSLNSPFPESATLHSWLLLSR